MTIIPLRNAFIVLCLTASCLGSLALIAQPPSYKVGVLIEKTAEFPCANECGPFEPVFFTFCVDDGAEVILGRMFDTRFNYDPNEFQVSVGKMIRFRNDSKNLWIVRPDGKDFRLTRDFTKGVYRDGRCVAELHRNLLAQGIPKRPTDVASDAVYVPTNNRFGFWTKCSLAADQAIICFARGPKGEEFSHVYQQSPMVHNNEPLAVDPLRTSYDNIVLTSGAVLIRKDR